MMDERVPGLTLAGYVDDEGWAHDVHYHDEVSQLCGPNSCRPLFTLDEGYTTIRSDSWRLRSDFGVVPLTGGSDAYS